MPKYEVCIFVESIEGTNNYWEDLDYIVKISHSMVEVLELNSIQKIAEYAIKHAKEDYPLASSYELEYIKEIQYIH